MEGVTFGEAWLERIQINFANVPAFAISRHHLIANKKATGRLQDLAGVERLMSTLN
jgi:hypothetical protein